MKRKGKGPSSLKREGRGHFNTKGERKEERPPRGKENSVQWLNRKKEETSILLFCKGRGVILIRKKKERGKGKKLDGRERKNFPRGKDAATVFKKA